jgi:hypothetical protein
MNSHRPLLLAAVVALCGCGAGSANAAPAAASSRTLTAAGYRAAADALCNAATNSAATITAGGNEFLVELVGDWSRAYARLHALVPPTKLATAVAHALSLTDRDLVSFRAVMTPDNIARLTPTKLLAALKVEASKLDAPNVEELKNAWLRTGADACIEFGGA